MTRLPDVHLSFTIPLLQVPIEEDTSELLAHDNFSMSTLEFNENPDEVDPRAMHDNRVLERYPKSKKLFTDLFNNITKNRLGIENKFTISTSWMTETKPEGKCQIHNHKNCYFSGVYYYEEKYDKDVGPLELYNPLEDLSSYALNYSEINPFTAGSIKIFPKPKLLVLFPSFLKHAIQTHKGKNVRKSLAFNFVPADDYGFQDSSYNHSWIP
tara:strand:- start:1257 stop:1892 length:636 start_codon:yes stop_codon:yes gene_type:complete